MTNFNKTVLYTGVSSNLEARVLEHKSNYYPKSFTAKYKCHKLVYYRFFSTIEEAIDEEKRLKGGNRAAKINLIISINPQWEDLSKKFE